jgi:hypothetical protein
MALGTGIALWNGNETKLAPTGKENKPEPANDRVWIETRNQRRRR